MEFSELKTILAQGVLATSGDNMQPWRFLLSGECTQLWIKPSQEKHFFETGNRTLYISAGAVIENIRVASAAQGYSLSVQYFPESQAPEWVATLQFEAQAKPSPHPHDEWLSKRCTNRKLYDPKKNILAVTFDNLSRQTDPAQGIDLAWIKKEDDRYEALSELLAEGDQMRFENKRIHTEFIQCVRQTQKHAQESRDGLDVETLEAGPGAHVAFRLLSCWPLVSLLNRLGFSRQFYQFTLKQMRSSSAVGLIYARSHEPKDYVLGGEIMQRVWHESTRAGLSLQPMEGIPVFLINLALEGDATFKGKQKTKVRDLKQRFLALFNLTEDRGLILAFRVGFAEAPSARSLRRPVESFIEHKE